MDKVFRQVEAPASHLIDVRTTVGRFKRVFFYEYGRFGVVWVQYVCHTFFNG